MKTALTLVAAFVAAVSIAQNVPNPPHLTVEMSGAFLALNPEIQTELKLSKDQVQKLNGAMAEYGKKAEAVSKKEPFDPTGYEKLDVETAGILLGMLSKAQRERMKQITLQLVGPSAMADAPIAKELGLKDAQLKSIEAKLLALDGQEQEIEAQMGEELEKLGEPKTPEQRVEVEKQRLEIVKKYGPRLDDFYKKRQAEEAKLIDLLEESQKAKWKAMLGPKFEPKRG